MLNPSPQPTQSIGTLTARDIMTSEVLEVGVDWTVDQLADFFVNKSISGAPVTTNQGELIGVVSMTDIVRHDSSEVEDPLAHSPHEYYVHGLQRHFAQEEASSYHEQIEGMATVGEIMTPMVFEVAEDLPVQQVASTMVRGRIHRVFVTRERRIVGVITALDVLRLIADC